MCDIIYPPAHPNKYTCRDDYIKQCLKYHAIKTLKKRREEI